MDPPLSPGQNSVSPVTHYSGRQKNLSCVSWISEGKDIGMYMRIHVGTGLWGCKEEPPVASATNLVLTKAYQSILHHLFCL